MKIDSILILAAGKGTRLKPYTDKCPKSLLPLGDTNVLRNLIMQSQNYFPGVEIFINASYLAEKIIEEISNFPLKNRPHVIWERNLLGPAFTVTNHCNKVDGNVLVLHGDTFFSDLTYSKLAYSINHKIHDVSLLLCHKRDKQNARSRIIESGGIIKSIEEITNDGSKKHIQEKKDFERVWSSSGALVVKRKSLSFFTPEIAASLSPSLINFIAGIESLYLEECADVRLAIDSEKSYLSAIELIKACKNLFYRTF